MNIQKRRRGAEGLALADLWILLRTPGGVGSICQKLTKTLDEYQRGALRSSADNIYMQTTLLHLPMSVDINTSIYAVSHSSFLLTVV